jgi:single stranded DNA-binding protein (ssb)
MNKVLLVGRIAKDPELRTTLAGISVSNFTLVVANYGKNLDGSKKEPSFIPCICWSRTAENLAKYNKKGSLVAVDGKIVPKDYINKDGVKVRYFEVNVDSIHFANVDSSREPGNSDVDYDLNDDDTLDEVPF